MENINTKPVLLAVIVGVCLLLGSIVASNQTLLLTRNTTLQTETERVVPDRNTINEDTSATISAWQQQLLQGRSNTRPLITDTDSQDISDRNPDATLTGRFGVALLEEVLLGQVENATDADVDEAIARVVDRVILETREDIYTVEDLQLVRTNEEATREYFNTAARTLQELDIQNTSNELDIFSRALRTNTPEAYTALEPIATLYGDLRDAYLEIPVPTKYYDTHLNMINVFNMLHNSLDDMSQAYNDPVRAYVRFQRYPDDAQGLSLNLVNMGMYVLRNQDMFAPNDPAGLFLTFLPSITNN